jgi:hypothetical protein
LINQKETYIRKLERIVKDTLYLRRHFFLLLSKKGECLDDFSKLEAELQMMFRISNFYDPRTVEKKPTEETKSDEPPVEKNENEDMDPAQEKKEVHVESPESLREIESPDPESKERAL